MHKRLAAILFIFFLTASAQAFCADFPDSIRFATQMRWVPADQALSIIESPDGQLQSHSICGSGLTLKPDTKALVPLEFGKKIRIEAKKNKLSELSFKYIFGSETAFTEMDCEDGVLSDNGWVLLSRMDEGFLQISTSGKSAVRLYKASSQVRPGFWDELAEQMLCWAARGKFEEKAIAFLSEVPTSHPAVPVIRFILVRIPPSWQKNPPAKKLYKKYLRTLIAYQVNQQRLLQEENISLLRSIAPKEKSSSRMFDSIFPYYQASRIEYTNLKPGFYLLDTRVGYTQATLSDLRRYRTEIRADGRPVNATLYETSVYRGWRGNGKSESLAGQKQRSVIYIPEKQGIEIVATSPVWARLTKAAGRPRFGLWAAGMTCPTRQAKGLWNLLDKSPKSADALFISAVLYNLSGQHEKAKEILASLVYPLDGAGSDNVALQEQIALRLQWSRAQGFDDPDHAFEMLQALSIYLSSKNPLASLQHDLFAAELVDISSTFFMLEGAYARAAAVIEPLALLGKADRLLIKRYLQSMIHSSFENPGRLTLPGLFQMQLSGANDNSATADLRRLKGSFLTWSQINQVLKPGIKGKAFFDRIEDAVTFVPVLDSSDIYYAYDFEKSIRLDLRQSFPETIALPYLVKGALISADGDAVFSIAADEKTVLSGETGIDPYEFELELPAGVSEIRPSWNMEKNPAGSILLLSLPPVSDRLQKQLSEKTQRFVKRSYELLPDAGLDFAFTTQGAETGVRILIRSESAIANESQSLLVTTDGKERSIRLRQTEKMDKPGAPFPVHLILPPGDHRITIHRLKSNGSSPLFVQLAVSEHRGGLFEVDRCMP